MNILDQAKSKMIAALEHLKNELKAIRTNRANPGMLMECQWTFTAPQCVSKRSLISQPQNHACCS